MRSVAQSPVTQAVLLLGGLFLGGTLGYRLLEGVEWWPAFYMTVITLTTVGYSEVFPLSLGGEIFTSVLLLTGIGMFLVLVTEIGRSVLEGELRDFWGRVRRTRMIVQMSDHEIVCGCGRMGRAVVDELRRSHRSVVVVERNLERIRTLQEEGIPVVSGDATDEATLIAAGIMRARGLVACLNDDAHNVYTVLIARSLHAELFIVARTSEDGAESRILRAGANRAVNPYQLSGSRLAHLLVKPAVVGFFDASLGLGASKLTLEQTALPEGSALVDRTLAEIDLRGRVGLGVVAVQRGTEFFPNPEPSLRLKAGDVMLVLGTTAQIKAFQTEYIEGG